MRRVIFAILLCMLVGIGLYVVYKSKLLEYSVESKSQQVRQTVKVVEAEMSDTGTILPLIGKVQANRTIEITPEVTARIEKILVKPTQEVKKGDLLIQLECTKAKSYLKEAKVNLDNELRKLDMAVKLRKQGVVSIDAYAQLEANVDKLRSIYEVKLAEVAERSIYAPFSGVLGLFSITEGQFVKPGNHLLTLNDISTVYVDFSVAEKYLSKIVLGQEVTATADAWPDFIFIGKVTNIDTVVNPDTLSVNVRVVFDNPSHKLLNGMMMELSMNLASEKTPIIPLKAISYVGDERFVYVLKKNGTVSRRKVLLGQINGSNVAIKQGIKLGTKVVIEGANKIKDGDAVNVLQDEVISDLGDDVPLKKKDKNNTKDSVL